MLIFHQLSSYFRLLNLGLIRFGTGMYRACFHASLFEIKRGYIHRKTVLPYNDIGHTDENQKEVYQQAAQWMHEHGLTSVIDIGCGSGFKLIKYLGELSTLGIDLDPVLSHTQSMYPQHKWINAVHFNPSAYTTDLILCSDTIEHVPDPDEFMKSIISIQDWQYMILSTPERNIKRGWYHYGPPPNPCHYREWSKKEFSRFISRYCHIMHHEIIHYVQGTQFVICRKLTDR